MLLLRPLTRCCQCFLNRPAFRKPIAQTIRVDSNFGGPVLQAEGFSVKGNESIRASISGLLSFSCPFAVRRPTICNALLAMTARITFRSIDSVNAVRCGWFRSHIGVEILKRLPSLAYYFAVLSIVWKVWRVRIMAALLHSFPRTVFWRVKHSVSAWIATVATISSQSTSTYRSFYSAGASTQPIGFSRRMVCCLCNHHPFTESLPSQVFETRVSPSRIAVSHNSVLLKQVVVRIAWALQRLGYLHFSTLAIREQC